MFKSRTEKIMSDARKIAEKDRGPTSYVNIPDLHQQLEAHSSEFCDRPTDFSNPQEIGIQEEQNTTDDDKTSYSPVTMFDSTSNFQSNHPIAEFVDETNNNNGSNLLESMPGPSYNVCNKNRLRKRPEWVDNAGPSDIEDSDDSIADPSYEVNDAGNQPRHIAADKNNIESDSSSESSIESKEQGRPKKGRKRKHKEQNRAQKKINKDSNETYFNYKGRKVEPKQFEDYRCSCPKKCSEKVCIEERKEQFTRFWSLKSYNAQTSLPPQSSNTRSNDYMDGMLLKGPFPENTSLVRRSSVAILSSRL
ncbi:uncharacterized protein LOC115884479 isoform X2 [Sitophilus oryzae]|uniref:Uncharacterized protein LOC115884479 isoform X2 n=1 Tax=Sitophilus oryzae TaxID=7048 RepID=A0A6J2Y551_SITOR|nr:uncharacterized protein LOC115884479 isoform X2 [Sitophilus oryzae]